MGTKLGRCVFYAEDEEMNIQRFACRHRITVMSEWACENPHMENSQEMDNWRVTLKRSRKRMILYFSKGSGHGGAEPQVEEVLDCLASDAMVPEDFEEFCMEIGYDEDSRRAERIHKQCLAQTEQLRDFLGNDVLEELLYATERL